MMVMVMVMQMVMQMLVGMLCSILRGRSVELGVGCGRVAEGAVGCQSPHLFSSMRCDASHSANDLLVALCYYEYYKYLLGRGTY